MRRNSWGGTLVTAPGRSSSKSRLTANDRIIELERRLAELQGAFVRSVLPGQYLGGRSRVFESAALALIASHPTPSRLATVMSDHLARTCRAISRQAISEENVNAALETERVIELALAEAIVQRRRWSAAILISLHGVPVTLWRPPIPVANCLSELAGGILVFSQATEATNV